MNKHGHKRGFNLPHAGNVGGDEAEADDDAAAADVDVDAISEKIKIVLAIRICVHKTTDQSS